AKLELCDPRLRTWRGMVAPILRGAANGGLRRRALDRARRLVDRSPGGGSKVRRTAGRGCLPGDSERSRAKEEREEHQSKKINAPREPPHPFPSQPSRRGLA